MKKYYIQPETLVILTPELPILAGASDPDRSVGGGPSETDGKTIPNGIGVTDGVLDPFGGMGQTGGNSTRVNESLWED